ncbi:MAG: hypothetical protein ACHQHN_06960 [Sphingobacteriales bacterium]
MEQYNRLWRAFILIGLIAITVQQLIYADFRPVVLPSAYPSWLGQRLIWTWIFSIALIAACTCVLVEFKARTASLLMAVMFLLLYIFFQVPSVISGPYKFHLGLWTTPFKELSFSGAAFVIAGTFPQENSAPDFIKQLGKLIPAGKYFFAFTLGLFGVIHFAYPEFCASLVPRWMHFYYFWMYFGAVGLITGGLGMMIKPTRHIAALLSGIMLFLWVILLHIPRAIADPHSGNGNEWTSVFEALAFSGIAFIISGKSSRSILISASATKKGT